MSFFFFQLNSSFTLSCSLRLNFARPLLIFCLVRSVSNSEARSLASVLFIEGDLINKPIFVTADNRLKYRAICCCINRSVLDNISGWCRLLNSIFGKSHQRRLPHQFPPLSSTRLGDNSLLSEKRWLFFVFSKEPIESPLGQLGIVRQNFYLRSDLECSHPLQNGKPVLVHFLLILSWAEFFLSASLKLSLSGYIWMASFSENISLSCSIYDGLGIALAMTRVQKSVHVADNHPLLRLVCCRFLM